VSRTRCSVLHDAPQSRDPRATKKVDPGISSADPGSAAHHAAKGGALRSIRGTEPLA